MIRKSIENIIADAWREHALIKGYTKSLKIPDEVNVVMRMVDDLVRRRILESFELAKMERRNRRPIGDRRGTRCTCLETRKDLECPVHSKPRT
jgi:hypothetical protein